MAQEVEEKQGKKGNSLLLIIIIIVLVLLLAIGGLIAFLVLGGSDNQQINAQDMQTMQQPQQTARNNSPKRSNDYINMGPIYPMDQFIVNLLSESGSRFLKTKVDLELNNEALTPEIDKKKSLIRDIIIRTLSSKTFEEVSTIKGKDRLKDEIVDRLNEVLADGHIKNIYFTDFVVQ
ncbi:MULTISPECIES: flagellar basal body-associated protein FliL [unclassified Campylobacter]|uniref:flagellar basal body-associated protein FliL n=1 Tax=unclassified Campylobacter TaxID=2593542 RepID=UPI00147400D1|nr:MULTISPECIES: flagellar basal body-associated protein FliL [unclassified Campylobacter]